MMFIHLKGNIKNYMDNKSLIRNEIKRVLNILEEVEEDSECASEEVVLKEKDPKASDIKKESKKELTEKDKNIPYGLEYVVDLHNVDKDKFKAEHVKKFAQDLCDEIGMKRGPIRLWGTDSDMDDWKNPKASGISCTQFLYSSSITIHAIVDVQKVFINIFSCHEFDTNTAKKFIIKTWGDDISSEHKIVRK